MNHCLAPTVSFWSSKQGGGNSIGVALVGVDLRWEIFQAHQLQYVAQVRQLVSPETVSCLNPRAESAISFVSEVGSHSVGAVSESHAKQF